MVLQAPWHPPVVLAPDLEKKKKKNIPGSCCYSHSQATDEVVVSCSVSIPDVAGEVTVVSSKKEAMATRIQM